MDLRDPQTSDVVPEPLRLFIDLNEIPSPPLDSPAALLDPLAVVRRYHDDPPPLAAPPAPFPGEPGLGPSPPPCPLCSLPELRGATIVCDACERGFHLSCTRIRACVAPALDEWACPDCSRLGLPSHRWPLGSVCPHPGYGGVRLLDINALPTSDGEGSDKFHGPRCGSSIHLLEGKNVLGNSLYQQLCCLFGEKAIRDCLEVLKDIQCLFQ